MLRTTVKTLVVKIPTGNAEDLKEPGSILGPGRSLGEENGKIPWTEEPGTTETI